MIPPPSTPLDDEEGPTELASPPCWLGQFDPFHRETPEPEPAAVPRPDRLVRNRLYLIRPGFQHESRGPFYCPGCVELIGLLESYPALKARVDVRFVDFPRPRAELVALLGEANQSCPVMILADDSTPPSSCDFVRQANGFSFIEGPREIGTYLARLHGTGLPF